VLGKVDSVWFTADEADLARFVNTRLPIDRAKAKRQYHDMFPVTNVIVKRDSQDSSKALSDDLYSY
jgi:hypothetical protein